jgi:hypothetical protein
MKKLKGQVDSNNTVKLCSKKIITDDEKRKRVCE